MLLFALAACTEEYETDSEPTVAKLYGEEMHKIKIFEAVGSETNNTNLPVAQATDKQHFNPYVDANIPSAAFSLYVNVGGEEGVGFGATPPVLDAEYAAPACPELLGKQSKWIRSGDEIDGIAAALSSVSKPSHMRPSPVSLQQ
jgi:hypothetical protein